jgi:hypothetical protein
MRDRKQRKDTKLTPERLDTIERCLKTGLTQRDIQRITGTNPSTISTVKVVLAWAAKGRGRA